MVGSTCSVCFMESFIDGMTFSKCSNLSCLEKICSECMERFIEICCKEHTTPRCFSPTCGSLYTQTQIPSSIQKRYQLCLFRGLLKEHQNEKNDEYEMKKRQKELFIKIREERLLFLSEEFPFSIQRAVQIMYGNDLRRIHKSNQALLQQQLSQMETKRCFRLFCQGNMRSECNPYWECGTCHSSYCQSCEKNWTSSHECKLEDKASVEWKKSLPHCPHCSLPIEKVDGCDAVTCAGCHKNFNYATGLPCESGNHGKTIPITLPTESVKELWKVLLRGRGKKDKNLTIKEKQMIKMLEDVEIIIEMYTLSSFSKPTWEWSIYDLQSVQQWLSLLSSNNNNNNNTDHQHSDPQQEQTIAKTVAFRVEKLETRRQQINHMLQILRSIEDELHVIH